MTTEGRPYLQLTIEGADSLDLGTFAKSATDLYTLLKRLTEKEAAGESGHWEVQTPGDFTVTASPNGVSAHALTAIVADSYTAALAVPSDSPSEWPESFEEPERRLMRKIVNRLRTNAPVHVKASEQEPQTIPTAERGAGRGAPVLASWGTVDGELRSISSDTGLQIRLIEHGSGVAVRCHIHRELLPTSMSLFEQMVRVHGYIYYRQNGRPSTIMSVTNVEPLQVPERELTEFKGLLPGLTDGLAPGEYVRRLRAGGDG